MKKNQLNKERWAAIAAAVVLFVCPFRSFAIESVTLPLEVEKEDVISMVLPTVTEGEKSPFDFILDPLGLLHKTNAARFGGGVVEEGATLLFENKEGEYNFSRYSDRLAVTNRSTVPALLTISAQVTDLGEMHMVESDDFTDSDDCSVYLAVVDNQGNEHPLSADGEVTIQVEMKAAPKYAYVYKLGDDLQSYQLVQSKDFEETDFDTYFLGLVGACNPNADWSDNISAHPMVTVTWQIEPIIAEQEETPTDERYTVQNEDDRIIGNESVSGNDSVPGNDSILRNEADPDAEPVSGADSVSGNEAVSGAEPITEAEFVIEDKSAVEDGAAATLE